MNAARIIAHRGGVWPGVPGEQTLAHVERAIAAGADFVEVDLRRTADGRIVCVHDPDHAGRAVAESSLAELQGASRAAGVPALLPLEALLEACAGRVGLDLELKVPGFEAEVVRAATRFGLGRILLKSFRDEVVVTLKRQAPEATVGLLLGVRTPRRGIITRLGELFPEARLLACGADFVSPHFRLLRAGFLARARLLGLPVYVWTVNERDVLARLAPQVAGLITDDPVLARRVVHGSLEDSGPTAMKSIDPNLKVIAILGLCFGGAIAISGSVALGALTAVAAVVAGMLATQPRKPKLDDGRLVRCPGPNCSNWMEPSRRRCPACERVERGPRL